MENEEFMRMLAAWALVHESADEGWKDAVARGENQRSGEMSEDPQAFVDGLSAMIAQEKDRLKEELASGQSSPVGDRADLAGKMDELHFEVSELRGRLESMQNSLDALADRSELKDTGE